MEKPLKTMTPIEMKAATDKAIKFIKNMPREDLIASALAYGVIEKTF